MTLTTINNERSGPASKPNKPRAALHPRQQEVSRIDGCLYGIHIGYIITTIQYSLSRNNPFSAYKKPRVRHPWLHLCMLLYFTYMDNIANNTALLP
ncbi:hypothetical protein [Paenibacillus xylanivorans]|uniref:hypothetical protein n=1 Tax=Paenibacillus xylanivorans TaxID=1705561 RepID=UPI0011873C49|nr:hypothetical protein [Paenibacillus xylanivorans]